MRYLEEVLVPRLPFDMQVSIVNQVPQLKNSEVLDFGVDRIKEKLSRSLEVLRTNPREFHVNLIEDRLLPRAIKFNQDSEDEDLQRLIEESQELLPSVKQILNLDVGSTQKDVMVPKPKVDYSALSLEDLQQHYKRAKNNPAMAGALIRIKAEFLKRNNRRARTCKRSQGSSY